MEEANTITDKELLKMYYKFYFSLGRVPTPEDINSNNEMYNVDVYIHRFQTMSNLRRLAGVPQIKNIKDPLTISKEEVKTELISIYKHFGKVSNKRLSELSEYGVATICSCFNTTRLNDIWRELESELHKDN